MTVHCCQFDISWENRPENFRRARALLDRCRVLPGSLVVLSEMFATGFSMNTRKIAEPKEGQTTNFLREMATNKQAYLVGGLVRRASGNKCLNEAVCIAPSGRTLVRYAKLQPFTPGGESKHYCAGKAVALFRWDKLKVAVFVCYDLRFPELFRIGVQRGADLFVVIANWPSPRHAHWGALLRARAIENQAYVVGVNRCGRDPNFDYAGESIVIDPLGHVIGRGGRRESVISAELDPSTPRRWRREFPVLADIRTAIKLKRA